MNPQRIRNYSDGFSQHAPGGTAVSIARPSSQEIPSRTVPTFRDPIKDPGYFHSDHVAQVAHYYLSVDAMTKPMRVREESPPYGGLEGLEERR